ncbi:MAG: hypothetical protein JWQ88_53 [Rhodoferax sp.]|nr:hypothetical protein [Rhodoferax sp.]
MNEPLVSICIPTYRGAHFIGRTIAAVIDQTYGNLQIIVVDDNSPDDTEAAVRKFGDERIRYVRNAGNLGPEGNWNRCRDLARGRYFKLLPHDDLLFPQCIASQVRVFEADAGGEIALVFGEREIRGPDDRVLMRRGLKGPARRIPGPKLVRMCVRAGGNLIGEPGNGLLRKELVDRIGPYDGGHPYVIDMDYWFRALAHGDGYYTGTKDSAFCINAGSWSVAIGQKQHLDFMGMVRAFQKDPRYRLTWLDVLIARGMARASTVLRQAMYRRLFP